MCADVEVIDYMQEERDTLLMLLDSLSYINLSLPTIIYKLEDGELTIKELMVSMDDIKEAMLDFRNKGVIKSKDYRELRDKLEEIREDMREGRSLRRIKRKSENLRTDFNNKAIENLTMYIITGEFRELPPYIPEIRMAYLTPESQKKDRRAELYVRFYPEDDWEKISLEQLKREEIANEIRRWYGEDYYQKLLDRRIRRS